MTATFTCMSVSGYGHGSEGPTWGTDGTGGRADRGVAGHEGGGPPPILAYLGSSRLRDRPDRLLRLLQRVDPVHRSPFGFWLLSGHGEIEAALRAHRLGTDDSQLDLSTLRLGPLQRATGTGHVSFDGPFGEVSRDLMLFKDPPDHTRLRGLVARAFTARRMRAIEHRIEAVYEDGSRKRLFLLFRDATSGTESYGLGRFVYAPLPDERGRLTIDFNLAMLPGCAFTVFATCPIPPKENRLAIPVRAGEREYLGPAVGA